MGENKALLQFNFKVVQIAPKWSYDPKNPHDYQKRVKILRISDFLGKFKFVTILAKIEYWKKNGCRWALGFNFIWKRLFKSFISGGKLVCEKNIRKVI